MFINVLVKFDTWHCTSLVLSLVFLVWRRLVYVWYIAYILVIKSRIKFCLFNYFFCQNILILFWKPISHSAVFLTKWVFSLKLFLSQSLPDTSICCDKNIEIFSCSVYKRASVKPSHHLASYIVPMLWSQVPLLRIRVLGGSKLSIAIKGEQRILGSDLSFLKRPHPAAFNARSDSTIAVQWLLSRYPETHDGCDFLAPVGWHRH